MSSSRQQFEYISDDQVTNALNVFQSDVSTNPVIFLLPALGVKAKFYDDFCSALSQRNVHIVTTDLRGNGLSRIRPSRTTDFGFNEILKFDIPKALEKLRELFPDNDLFFAGHSLGGQLFSLYASNNTVNFKGIILLASCSVYYKGWSGIERLKTLGGTQFIGALSQIMGYFPGKKIGFGGTEAKTLMKDWSRQARTGIYRVSNSNTDFESQLSRMTTKVLAINFKADDLCPKAATKNLIQKYNPSSEVEYHLLVGKEKKLNHFNWVKYNSEVLPLITEFVEA